VSENRSALIVEGNPTSTVRGIIEHPQWPRAVSLPLRRSFRLPGSESDTRKCKKWFCLRLTKNTLTYKRFVIEKFHFNIKYITCAVYVCALA